MEMGPAVERLTQRPQAHPRSRGLTLADVADIDGGMIALLNDRNDTAVTQKPVAPSRYFMAFERTYFIVFGRLPMWVP